MKVIINPDAELVRDIREKLEENGGFCPCRLKRDASTKCMCKEFREQIKRGEAGECHCGLYVAVDEE